MQGGVTLGAALHGPDAQHAAFGPARPQPVGVTEVAVQRDDIFTEETCAPSLFFITTNGYSGGMYPDAGSQAAGAVVTQRIPVAPSGASAGLAPAKPFSTFPSQIR
ncbi:MAG: hypothetical protein LBK22_04145 [Tannerella sp.]|nr:hypothetical protein [Tannerella sp.]